MKSRLQPHSVKSEPGILQEREKGSDVSHRSCSYPSGLDEVTDVFSKLMNERSVLASSFTKLKVKNQALMACKRQMEQNSRALQMKLHEATMHIRELEANADADTTTQFRLSKLTDGVRHFIAETEKEMGNYEHSVAELERAKGLAEENGKILKVELLASKAREENLHHQLEITKLAKFNLEKDIQGLDATLLSKTQAIEKMEAEKEALQKEGLKLYERERNLRAECEETQRTLVALLRDCDSLKAEVHKITEENQSLTSQCKEKLSKAISVESELKYSKTELHTAVSEAKTTREELVLIKEQNIRLTLESQHKDELIAGLRQQVCVANRDEQVLKNEIKCAMDQLGEQRQLNARLTATTSQLEAISRELNKQVKEKDVEKETQREEIKALRSTLAQVEHQLMLRERDFALASKEFELSSEEVGKKMKTLQEEMTAKDVQLRRMTSSAATLESEKSKTHGERSTLAMELKVKEKELSTLTSKLEEYSQAMNLYKSTAMKYQDENEVLQKTLIELRGVMSEACSEVKRFKDENRAQAHVNESLVKELETLASEHNAMVWKFADTKKQLESASQEIKATKSLHEAGQLHNDKVEMKFERLILDTDNLKQVLIDKEDELKAKVAENARLLEDLKVNKHEYDLNANELGKCRTTIDDLQKQVTSLTIDLERERFQTKALNEKTEIQESEKLRLAGKLDSEKKSAKILSTREKHLNGELLRMEEKVRSLENEIKRASDENVRTDSRCKAASIDLANTQKSLKELERVSNNQLTEISQLRKELTEARSQVNSLQVTTSGQTQEVHELEAKKREWRQKLAELEDKVASGRIAEEKISAERSTLVNAVQTLKEKLETTQEKLGERERLLSETSAELKSTKLGTSQLQEENAKIRAMCRELQGIIDGSVYKERWILEREQMISNEAKSWRENSEKMEKRMIAYREQFEHIQLVHQKALSDLENSRDGLIRAERKAELFQKEMQELISSLQSKCANTETRLQNLQMIAEQQVTSLSEYERKNADILKAKEGLEAELTKVKITAHETENQLRTAKELLNQVQAERNGEEAKFSSTVSELKRVVKLLKETQIERDHVRLMLATSDQDSKRLTYQLQCLESEIISVKSESAQLEQEKAKVQGECDALRSKIQIFQLVESARVTQQKGIEEKLKDVEDRLKNAQREASEAKLRLSLLNEQRNRPDATPSLAQGQPEHLLRMLQALVTSACADDVTGPTLQDLRRSLEELSMGEEEIHQERKFKPRNIKGESWKSVSMGQFNPAQKRSGCEESWIEAGQIRHVTGKDSIQHERKSTSTFKRE